MYKEKDLNKSWKWLLILATCAVLLPQLGIIELQNDEAIHGHLARGIQHNKNIFFPSYYGETTSILPLYPALIALFDLFLPTAIAVRIPSIIGMMMMIYISAFMAYRHQTRLSAIVSGACMMSSLIAVNLAAKGSAHILGSAFIAVGWCLWFEFSRYEKNWRKAWLFACTFSLLAFFTFGFKGVLYFFLPIFFLRRPTDVRKRFLHPFFLGTFASMVLIIICYYILNHNIKITNDIHSFSLINNEKFFSSVYFSNFLKFPIQALFYFLPWTFLSWPAFCEAFKAMEKDHVLFHVCRTLSFSLFILVWLLPGTQVEDLLPSLVPMSIMTGMHYQILVRRHHLVLKTLTSWIFKIVLTISISLIVFFLYNIKTLEKILIGKAFLIVNTALLVISVLVCIFFIAKGKKYYPIWLRMIFASLCFQWCLLSLKSVPNMQHTTKKRVGHKISIHIPEQIKEIYYHYPTVPLSQSHAQLIYIDRMIINIPNTLDEKIAPDQIYLISDQHKPTTITKDPSFYIWKKLPKVSKNNDDIQYQVWQGTRRDKKKLIN